IPAIANRPAYRVDEKLNEAVILAKSGEAEGVQGSRVGNVKFELFNSGKWNSKVRVMFENRIDKVRGLQVELKLEVLPRFVEVWGMMGAGYSVAWARGDHGKLVVLVYAEEGRYMEIGERVLFVISAPELDMKDLIDSEPRVIASVANLSEYVSFSVEGFSGELPLEYELYQNYPNPFNMGTEIRYDVPEYSEVKIIVWNVLGQRVRVLVDGRVDPGRKVVRWDGKDEEGRYVGSGVYFYTIYARSLDREDKEFLKTRKAIVLK
ncbi:MAG: T9SS type A sorting domain-containing protein, partial [Candidatus Kryptonium sp.]